MRMITIAAMLVLIAGLPTSAIVQTPDGETPVNEGICDELIGGTPGLYGLCVAFCEAQDLHLLDLGDPDALKHGPSNLILERYRKKMQPGDPIMPCVHEPCPCWTQQHLDGLRFPSVGSSEFCLKDGSILNDTNSDFWDIRSHPSFVTFVITGEVFDERIGLACALVDICEDNNCFNVIVSRTNLTEAEFTICEVQVAESGAVRGFDCFLE